MNESTSEYYGFRQRGLISGMSYRVRKRIYDVFCEEFADARSIADVGASSEAVSKEANVLEALYPHKERITAIGIEPAQHLEQWYPGLRFVQVLPGQRLPFADDTFDVVYSHAVIEHVVDPVQRLFFLSELVRIGRSAFVTTPNKFFVVDPHTMVPILHFLAPRLYYRLLDRKILNRFYNSSNLRLMSRRELWDLARHLPGVRSEIRTVRLFGMVSNLLLVIRKR